jgi:hypothetical protein
MFAGQTVTFLPRVSKGAGGEEKLFLRPIIILGTTYDVISYYEQLFMCSHARARYLVFPWIRPVISCRRVYDQLFSVPIDMPRHFFFPWV